MNMKLFSSATCWIVWQKGAGRKNCAMAVMYYLQNMKIIQLLAVLFVFASCNSVDQKTSASDSTNKTEDSISVNYEVDSRDVASPLGDTVVKLPLPIPKTYFNDRFRKVTVNRTGDSTFVISGEGQIFEASFGWVIEDGHNELKNGYATTDAGAPEWGKFRFEITAEKKRPNSTLHLVLFESSAKDGSRVHQLPVKLY